jgi:hypothetical protein
VRIPTITDPRGTDFAKAGVLKQAPWMLTLDGARSMRSCGSASR